MRVRVKICCIMSQAEAAMASGAGADLLGLVGPMPTGPGTLELIQAAPIAATAPAWASPILLTSSDTAADITADVVAAGVRAVQLVRHVAPAVHDQLAETHPDIRRIQVIHVEGPDALDLIPQYSNRADAFLLDSGRPSARELGGTGRTHDWQISREFVQASPIPVFLAGGLGPHNVADAIRQVRPFGVDICSGVRTGGALDQSKLSAFMQAVAAA